MKCEDPGSDVAAGSTAEITYGPLWGEFMASTCPMCQSGLGANYLFHPATASGTRNARAFSLWLPASLGPEKRLSRLFVLPRLPCFRFAEMPRLLVQARALDTGGHGTLAAPNSASRGASKTIGRQKKRNKVYPMSKPR